MLDTEILFNAYRRRSGTEPINDVNISIRDRLGNADSYKDSNHHSSDISNYYDSIHTSDDYRDNFSS